MGVKKWWYQRQRMISHHRKHPTKLVRHGNSTLTANDHQAYVPHQRKLSCYATVAPVARRVRVGNKHGYLTLIPLACVQPLSVPILSVPSAMGFDNVELNIYELVLCR